MESTPGFEPVPHWWEASALTTAPPFLPEGGTVDSRLGTYETKMAACNRKRSISMVLRKYRAL